MAVAVNPIGTASITVTVPLVAALPEFVTVMAQVVVKSTNCRINLESKLV
jgi:hypothetical protein